MEELKKIERAIELAKGIRNNTGVDIDEIPEALALLIKVAKSVVDCEGLVEKKDCNSHGACRTCKYWDREGDDCKDYLRDVNEALDLFPVLMAKKCLECKERKEYQELRDSILGDSILGESKEGEE